MRALVLTEFGDADHFELREIPAAEPAPGEVLIRVAATGVNPVDYKIRRGGSAVAPELPAVLGMDVAGTVEAVGDGVTGFREGDVVYGCAGGLLDLPGAMAETMAADARLLAPKPQQLSFREAAALPLVSITAWEGLVDRVDLAERADVASGEAPVLVYGGTGGVGHLAVQLARAHGGPDARIVTTASSQEKAALARDLGADEVSDYTEESPEELVERVASGKGFTVVYDSVGGDNLDRAIEAAGLNADVVTIVARQSHDLGPAMAKGLSLHIVFMLLPMIHGVGRAHHGEILRGVNELVAAGELRPLLDARRFTLEEGADAHRHLESGEAIGKVVIDVA